jgi:ferredoxin
MFLLPGGLAPVVFRKDRGQKIRPSREASALSWDRHKCMLCACCVPLCESGALTVTETHLDVDHGACTRCGACALGCPTGALRLKVG